MKCLVTGATGHIGCCLVRLLCAEGHDVRILALPHEGLQSLDGQAVEVLRGNILSPQDVQAAVQGQDVVFHLAGIIGIGSGQRKLMHNVNVEGTQNVVLACKMHPDIRMVYVSSVHAIAEEPHGTTICETDCFSENQVYGAYAKTKAKATALVLNAVQKGLNAVVVHPSGVIGPYEYTMSNVGQMVLDFMQGRLIAYTKGGYNFVDVRDVAQGIVSAAEKGVRGQCYILSGHSVTVKSLLQKLSKITQRPMPRVVLPHWFALFTGPFAELYYKILRQKPLYTTYSIKTLVSNHQFSYQKAEKELGYHPRSLDETLKDTVDWLKHHPKMGIKAKHLKRHKKA